MLINNQGSEAFWQSIIPDKSIRERTLNMWKLAGMDSDARRFAKGKQILIATERALSDALHKHSAEMRDVYPLCGRAGISTREADKFMRPAGRGECPAKQDVASRAPCFTFATIFTPAWKR